MTTPRFAKDVPSKIGCEPAPVTNPPPCIHTITGSRSAPDLAGVQILSVRQSSDDGGLGAGRGHGGPGWMASLTSVHGGDGSGARHRNAPMGGAAYGMPLKAVTSSVSA